MRRRQECYARRGAANGMTKLTDEQILEVRRRAARGETLAALAIELDVSRSHLSRVCNGYRRETVTA